jgi:hypothetical protein
MTNDIPTQPMKPFLYKTSNRGLAAALMALGFELLDVDRLNGEVLFGFPVSRMLLDAADSYLVDTLSVSANRMGEAFDRLDDLASGRGGTGEVDIDDL